MKKPMVILFVQIYFAWFALGAALSSAFIVGAFNGRLPIAQAVGAFLVGIVYLAGAATLLVKISRRQTSRRWIALGLWIALAWYPIINALRHFGLFRRSSISDDQLAHAALVEILRYLVPLALILWLSLSKRSAEYLSASADSSNSLPDDARNARVELER